MLTQEVLRNHEIPRTTADTSASDAREVSRRTSQKIERGQTDDPRGTSDAVRSFCTVDDVQAITDAFRGGDMYIADRASDPLRDGSEWVRTDTPTRVADWASDPIRDGSEWVQTSTDTRRA